MWLRLASNLQSSCLSRLRTKLQVCATMSVRYKPSFLSPTAMPCEVLQNNYSLSVLLILHEIACAVILSNTT